MILVPWWLLTVLAAGAMAASAACTLLLVIAIKQAARNRRQRDAVSEQAAKIGVLKQANADLRWESLLRLNHDFEASA